MGHPKFLVETSVISSLPEIVKKEILHPSVKDKEVGKEERQKIALRLVSAFQMTFPKPEGVEFENGVKPMEIAVAEFGAYLKVFPYHLTGEEILEAYRMASRGELKDFLGNQIELYPNLKTPQAGKILMAYQDYKIDNQQHTLGIQKLKKIVKPDALPTPEETKALKRQNWEVLLETVRQNKPCAHAFLFYELVIKKGGLQNFIQDHKAQSIVIKRKMQQIIWDEKKKVKSSLFNNFEIKHILEYFKDEILEPQVQFAFERLKAMATVQVKNDLVYNWLKKELKRNEASKVKSGKS
jgi:hypothetical protein